jgi:plastocyanin
VEGAKMRKQIIFSIVILTFFLFLITACSKQQTGEPAVPANNQNTQNQDTPAQATQTITIKNFAFSPDTLTVKKGTIVTWINEDSAPHLVASDPHPAHTDLPGLQSTPLSKGQGYSFTFDKVGSWGYHCHLHPSMKGTIIVTE